MLAFAKIMKENVSFPDNLSPPHQMVAPKCRRAFATLRLCSYNVWDKALGVKSRTSSWVMAVINHVPCRPGSLNLAHYKDHRGTICLHMTKKEEDEMAYHVWQAVLHYNNSRLTFWCVLSFIHCWSYKGESMKRSTLFVSQSSGRYSHTWAWWGGFAVMPPFFLRFLIRLGSDFMTHHNLIDPLVLQKKLTSLYPAQRYPLDYSEYIRLLMMFEFVSLNVK